MVKREEAEEVKAPQPLLHSAQNPLGASFLSLFFYELTGKQGLGVSKTQAKYKSLHVPCCHRNKKEKRAAFVWRD